MANTGRKVYQFLKQVDADTLTPTGVRKANTIGDSDYVAPVSDFTTCPLISWQATGPFCVVDGGGNNTGMKGFATRARLTNGSLDGYSETNANGSGLGPYFPPVSDTISCPLPVIPPPPPPPPPPPTNTLKIINSFSGVTITSVSGIPGMTPAFTPLVNASIYNGTHGAYTSHLLSFTRTGSVPAGPAFHARLKINGITIAAIQADSTTTYNFPLTSATATDIIQLELST